MTAVRPMVAFGDSDHVSFLWSPGFRSRPGTLSKIVQGFKSSDPNRSDDYDRLFPALIIVKATPLQRAVLRFYAQLGYCTIVKNPEKIRERLPI